MSYPACEWREGSKRREIGLSCRRKQNKTKQNTFELDENFLFFKKYFSGPNFIPTSDSKATVYQEATVSVSGRILFYPKMDTTLDI